MSPDYIYSEVKKAYLDIVEEATREVTKELYYSKMSDE